MIDLDRNAAAPLLPEVRQAMVAAMAREDLGNPSSVHRHGQAARAVLEDCRRAVLESLGLAGKTLVFTSGGTEAASLAVLGAARALQNKGRPAKVLTSPLEHPAVLGSLVMLGPRGSAWDLIEVDGRGRIDIDDVVQRVAADPEVGLVSLSCAHHELGNVTELAELAAQLRAVAPEALVHTDAAQAWGRLPPERFVPGVDLVSLSGAKVGGPPGIGALILARHVALEPLWGGGKQERGLRPGTESWLLAAGLQVAATHAARRAPGFFDRVGPVTARLRAGLEALGARCVGDVEHHLGNTVLVGFPGIDGQLVVMALDLAGVRCSTGAACSAGTLEPSAVLLALGYSRDEARTAVRFSLGPDHTLAQMDELLALLPGVLRTIRAAAESVEVAR